MKNNLILSTLLICLLGALSFTSCNSGASLNIKGSAIKGQFKDASNITAYFDQIQFDNSNIVLGKADIDGSGNFQMNMEDELKPGIYRMRIGAKKAFFLFDGKEKLITINGDLSSFDKYGFEVGGSAVATEFSTVMKNFMAKPSDRSGVEKYVGSTSNNLGAAFLAFNIFQQDPTKLDLMKQIKGKLQAEMPDSKYASDFGQLVSTQESRIAAMQATQAIQVGKPAPEIKLAGPDGKERALSDLKGKVVLLDFWASWCGPCRRANPHVVDTYKKYKSKGFTVFSVSLDGINPRMKNRYKSAEQVNQQMDQAKERWMAAIEKDNLMWDWHVSDLQHWNSVAAKAYGVRSIPQTFLIDRDGNIGAINPRNNLEEQLKRFL